MDRLSVLLVILASVSSKGYLFVYLQKGMHLINITQWAHDVK